MFREVPSQINFPELEREILRFWEENRIFQKSVEGRDSSRRFVFYEGPPTANGTPGIHHVISRTIKDLVCRLRTMQGYRVERKAGWDTHGLPVEIEVEKELRFTSKDQILKYGVAQFNQKCKESVFRYKREWDEMTKRIGFWVDLENPYITYSNEYIETIWWILKKFWERGLIYKSLKILPYCPRCETPLSSHEVSLGYRDTEDPSIFVKMKAEGEDNTYFLVWTTTPWTLISNVALAVHPELNYVKVLHRGENLILAEQRLSVIEGEFEVLEEFLGRVLEGRKYQPLFRFCHADKRGFYVIPGDFVTMEEGTGIVHIAPAFGEDDHQVGQKFDLPILQPVDKGGRFTQEVKPFKGKFVKDADPEIIADLRGRGLLYKEERILHSYPFCWRCDSPLLYYAKSSWYIRTTAFKDRLLENNRKIRWFPREVGEGRFGEWLENNVDWALSRDRFWGTPLNIWICEKCGKEEAIGGIEELKERSGLTQITDLHKPYIDQVKLPCPSCRGQMVRTPEVIDCWFDSGSMPYAQWHYPFENQEKFQESFPADFISEGIDQTRGWFYSLLAISTLLFDQPCYKTCLSIELILDKEGRKMSKSLGNTVDPFEILDEHGADPLRWYLLTVSPPWVPTRFDPAGILEVRKKFFGTLINVYSFFVLYANIDGFRYAEERIDPKERPQMDRWIISCLNSLVKRVNQYLEGYELTRAARSISDFVIDDLSNWYVRRCRRRFWKSEMGPDKLAAYQTLYEVLMTISKLIAPYTPFLAEEIYRNLNSAGKEREESVHLTHYPHPDEDCIDEALEEKMDLAREVVYLNRSLRNRAKIKIRQPLRRSIVLLKNQRKRELLRTTEELIREEINVKEVFFTCDPSDIMVRRLKPDFKKLGPRFGKETNRVAEIIQAFPEEEIDELLREEEKVILLDGKEEKITLEEVEVVSQPVEGLIIESEGDLAVALDVRLTDELIAEGLARDFINRVQNMRKEAGFQVVDRIKIFYQATDRLNKAIKQQSEYIKNETLALALVEGFQQGECHRQWDINGERVDIGIERVKVR